MCVLNVVSHQRNFTAIKVIAQPSYPTYSKLKTFHKVHCCLMRYYILTEAIFFKQPRLIQVGKYQNIKTVHFLKISFLQLELVFSGINKVLTFIVCMQYEYIFQKSFHPIMGCVARKENLPIVKHRVLLRKSKNKGYPKMTFKLVSRT